MSYPVPGTCSTNKPSLNKEDFGNSLIGRCEIVMNYDLDRAGELQGCSGSARELQQGGQAQTGVKEGDRPEDREGQLWRGLSVTTRALCLPASHLPPSQLRQAKP